MCFKSFTGFCCAVVIGLFVSIPAQAKDTCTGWKTPENDPTGGQYALQMRICEVTYGLTAYVQLRNDTEKELDLHYLITFVSNKTRDEHVIVAPSTIFKVGMCQACAKRHDGFKSWEIVEVKETEAKEELEEGETSTEEAGSEVEQGAEGSSPEPTSESTPEPVSGQQPSPGSSTETEASSIPVAPVAEEEQTTAVPTEAPVESESEQQGLPPEFRPAEEQEAAPEEVVSDEKTEAPADDSAAEGEPAFNIEDLPPEFRPR